MEYYTGIVFRGFMPGIGYPIVSGGRYDELIGHFGRELPAVGFALEIERVMMGLPEPDEGPTPDVVAEACGHPECNNRIAAARAGGTPVLVDVLGRRGAALEGYASGLGVRRVLHCLRKALPCE